MVLERRVVKQGFCKHILQAESVPLTFLRSFTQGGRYACSSSEEEYHNQHT